VLSAVGTTENIMKTPKDNKSDAKNKRRNSVLLSLLLATLASSIPIRLIADYRAYGYIYSGKTRMVTATGTEALVIIYGISAAIVIMWLYVAYNALRYLLKDRHTAN